MGDVFDDLDALLQEQEDSPDEWKAKALQYQNEVGTLKERLSRLIEAVEEERKLQEMSYQELLNEYKTSEERATTLETKLLKIIEMVRSDKQKPSSSPSQSNDDNSELLKEATRKVEESNERARLAEEQKERLSERVKLLESKLLSLASSLKEEQENTKKHIKSNSANKKVIESLQIEVEKLKSTSNNSGTSSADELLDRATKAEFKSRNLEAKLGQVVSTLKEHRIKQRNEMIALVKRNTDLEALLKQTDSGSKLEEVEQENVVLKRRIEQLESQVGNNSRGTSDGDKDERIRSLEQKLKKTTEDSEKKLKMYQVKIQKFIGETEVKLKQIHEKEQQSSNENIEGLKKQLADSQKRLAEAEQQLHHHTMSSPRSLIENDMPIGDAFDMLDMLLGNDTGDVSLTGLQQDITQERKNRMNQKDKSYRRSVRLDVMLDDLSSDRQGMGMGH